MIRQIVSFASVRFASLVVLWLAVVPSALTVLSGCDEFSFTPASERNDCSSGIQPSFTGQWTITGTGERYGCDDFTFNGPVRLQSGSPWVASKPAGAGADVPLSVDPGVAGVMVDNVDINQACISFRVYEPVVRDGQSETASMRFSGRSNDGRTVYGEFRGAYSASGCQMDGAFELTIE